MATNYEKYFGTPEKAAAIIYRLRYPRLGDNHIPDDFDKAWLDWFGRKLEQLDCADYSMRGLWIEFLQEECDV